MSSELDVAYVARLARLELSAEETEFPGPTRQSARACGETGGGKRGRRRTGGARFPDLDVVREDEPRPGLTVEEALRNAPRTANGLFIVTKVLE